MHRGIRGIGLDVFFYGIAMRRVSEFMSDQGVRAEAQVLRASLPRRAPMHVEAVAQNPCRGRTRAGKMRTNLLL